MSFPTRCTRPSPAAVPVPAPTPEKTAVAEAGTPNTFYLAPFLGVGAFFTNELVVDNSAYFNGEVRFGYKLENDIMLQASVDTGLNAKKFSYPVITTIVVGPEYFFIPTMNIHQK